ncbi:DUF4235 domain-containing protein [Bifidobacterium oedipodis]|uniref:DUF4235 domain-containing protein n=1 Tax=Bifidobacterium oedipodis TaxID=2675322 RepID=A0A7Y0ER26_9BIFI|nr:hypothetical protein [Bifidobacterium sp. DSM 109957]
MPFDHQPAHASVRTDTVNSGTSAADSAVDALHRIDEKVNALRDQRLNDPETLGDKILKFALPSLTGLIAGKLFQTLWNKGVSRRNLRRGLAADAQQGFAMTLAFAAASAALGAVVSQLSDRGSQALVNRRHQPKR